MILILSSPSCLLFFFCKVTVHTNTHSTCNIYPTFLFIVYTFISSRQTEGLALFQAIFRRMDSAKHPQALQGSAHSMLYPLLEWKRTEFLHILFATRPHLFHPGVLLSVRWCFLFGLYMNVFSKQISSNVFLYNFLSNHVTWITILTKMCLLNFYFIGSQWQKTFIVISQQSLTNATRFWEDVIAARPSALDIICAVVFPCCNGSNYYLVALQSASCIKISLESFNL